MLVNWFRDRRRRRILARPFPDEWLRVVESNVTAWRLLGDDDRRQLLQFTSILVAEKFWEGCNGLEITDEVRVTIAANAGLLTLGFGGYYFDRLKTILVYPDRYVAKSEHVLPGGIVSEGRDVRLGEAWTRGPVILAWADVLEGGRSPDDGRNVVLHEFAHLLDMAEGGIADGTPFLESEDEYLTWRDVMGRAHRWLVRETRRGRRTLLDGYGATNEAEFFAVATECFFERSRLMARELPEVHAVLRHFYRQDPSEWAPR